MSDNPVRDSSPSTYYSEDLLEFAEAIHHGDIGRLEQRLSKASLAIKGENKKGVPLLLYAAALGNMEAVQVLLRNGANPNDIGDIGSGASSLLAIGASMENDEFFYALLNAGADPNGVDGTDPPIFLAMLGEHWDRMTALINKGADLNRTDSSGATPILALALTSDYEQVMTLLDLGADADYVSDAGLSLRIVINEIPLDLNSTKGQWQQKVISRLNL